MRRIWTCFIVLYVQVPFSKRYLKYLTKKYLKRNSLRDWLRVVASSKDTYELRYFQISQDDEDASDNEAARDDDCSSSSYAGTAVRQDNDIFFRAAANPVIF
uniref:Large ribosomal subunit protein eL22 n=1 Tax=Ascaris lumbricoides TaxID=6252 RepID=A0A0M3HJ58_ASCLU